MFETEEFLLLGVCGEKTKLNLVKNVLLVHELMNISFYTVLLQS